jgi:pimeloyl-ACP methyl ester carboxylesterase
MAMTRGFPTRWYSALEFEAALDRVDRQRYQPWVLQYPSGVDLNTVSNYFVRALDTLQERHGFEKVMVVAHSMGGLMTRGMVLKANQQARPWSLSLVVTAASPLLGMPSASSGVEHSPIVVPSWRDLAPGSDYLEDVHTQDWPRDVPYRLVFTYLSGEPDDGVVPLDRQINLKLQNEARSIFGVNATHVGVLSDEAFLERLETWMDQAASVQ